VGKKPSRPLVSRELAVFLKVEKVIMFDLTDLRLKPGIVALHSAALQGHQQGYHFERKKTGQMVENEDTSVHAGQVTSTTRRDVNDDEE
jgi:hypothetical protein